MHLLHDPLSASVDTALKTGLICSAFAFRWKCLRVQPVFYLSFLCWQRQLSVAHRATLTACYDSHAKSLYLCCSNGSAPTLLTFIIYGCSQTQTSAYSPVGSSLCLLFPLPFFCSFLSHCLEITSLAFVALIFQAKAKNIETVAGPLEEVQLK